MELVLSDLAVDAGRRLLAGASARMAPGQLWCILGRNGAGKSTLLRTLAGFAPPAQGRVCLDERDLSDWPLTQLARARAFLPQQMIDWFSASVYDTVMDARYPHQGTRPRQFGRFSQTDDDAVQDALSRLGLVELASRDVLHLSGGERRRVALATTLAQGCPLLLLDEPSAHLDLAVEARVFALLRAHAAAGACVVASVHDPNLAARYASHVMLLLPTGEVLSGETATTLTAMHLGRVFAHRISEVSLQGRRWFLLEEEALDRAWGSA